MVFSRRNWIAYISSVLLIASVFFSSSSAFTTTTSPLCHTSPTLREDNGSINTQLRSVADPPSAVLGEETVTEQKEPESLSAPIAKNHSADTDVVGNAQDDDMTIFDIVAARAALCLFESELRRDAKIDDDATPASSATNWINDSTAFALKQTIDRLKLKVIFLMYLQLPSIGK
jgi:hypothetical protein